MTTILILNKEYDIKGGSLVPRSHFNKMSGAVNPVALIEVYWRKDDGRVIKESKLLTKSIVKQLLGLTKGAGVEIE